MDAEVIKEIVKLRDDSITRIIKGREFSPVNLKPVLFEPRMKARKIHTLTGIVLYIQENLDKALDKNKEFTGFLHVVDPGRVELISEAYGDTRERDYFLMAELDEELKTFPFEKYMSSEDFIIRLRSQFSPTFDIDRLIAYTSKLTISEEITKGDDGITQLGTQRKGASGAVTEKAPAPVIVRLKPFRTFRELDQIESEFLFRMKIVGGETLLALFEADGGRWRNDAILAIETYLGEKLPDTKIIA